MAAPIDFEVYFNGIRELRRGDEGQDVADVQRMLHPTDAGEPLEIDGIFGPKSEARIKKQQQEHFKSVTGVVDRYTWATLLNSWAIGWTDVD